MSIFNQIVPGQVINNGINDVSIPEYDVTIATAPLHLPVISGTSPIGGLASEVGTQWVAIKDFAKTFGDILDPETPYYGPIGRLIAALADGGQGTIGFRRLSANNVKARAAVSAFVFRTEQQQYERDAAGRFKYSPEGDRIPIVGETIPGIDIQIKLDDVTGKNPGELEVRTIAAVGEVPETVVYPLYEAMAGVGEDYNRNGFQFGVQNTTSSWRSVSDFVRKTGVFPYQLREFQDTKGGIRTFAKAPASSQEIVPATLFDVTYNKVKYGLDNAFRTFTGTNVNRPQRAVPAPINGSVVYQENIAALCQLMYHLEKPVNDNLVDAGRPGEQYKQMNPFTCQDHTGAPYYACTSSGVMKWDLSGAIKVSGGLSPFVDSTGKLPAGTTAENLPDPFGLLNGLVTPTTVKQGWEITNKLMVSDLTTYVNSSAQKDVTRNRQSIWWDVGFSQEVKDVAIQFLGARKDIFVQQDATIWTPGEANPLDEVYARADMQTTNLRMTPESEKWGTPACRAAINKAEIKLTGEPTGWYFSANIDKAQKYAGYAGADTGRVNVSKAPDTGDNRKITIGYDSTIQFEATDIQADGFSKGHTTLIPWDWNGQVYRPGLPTVHTSPDSVLKDEINVFNCVGIEKISADQWKRVVGDRSLDQDSYEAIMKDSIEEECRNGLGGAVAGIVAETSYATGQVGDLAILNVVVHGYFNKAKYMMEFDLYAHNSNELNSSN